LKPGLLHGGDLVEGDEAVVVDVGVRGGAGFLCGGGGILGLIDGLLGGLLVVALDLVPVSADEVAPARGALGRRR